MAGEWLKFDASTPEKPEVFAITVALGWDDPDLTVGKLLKVWRWFDQQTIDGNAANVTLALLDKVSGVSGFAKAMCDVGWLIQDEHGLTLPNFERHNGKTAKDRALTAKRVAKHKHKGTGNAASNGDSVTPVVTSPLPREEKRREEKKEVKPPTKPAPLADDDLASQVVEVIEHLNAKTKRNFSPGGKAVHGLVARLREGRTVAQCKAVIDLKCQHWLGDRKMEVNLNPTTLFRATNFDNYLGFLPADGQGPAEDPKFAGAK